MNTVLFILAVSCGIATSQYRECMGKPVMSPFDEERFAGDWYVVGVSQELGNIPKACIRTHYSVAGQNSSISLQFNLSLAKTAVEGDDIWIFDSQKFHPGLTGLNQTFFQDDYGVWDGVGQIDFLTTDYDQFAIVYSCFHRDGSTVNQGPMRSTFQIWSRNQTLHQTVFNTIKVMFVGMDYGIGTRMKVVDNSEC